MPTTPTIEAALFKHLLSNAATPLIGSTLGGALIAAAHFDSPYQQQVLWWLLALWLVTAVRALLTVRCKRRIQKQGYQHQEALHYALTTGLSGVLWGIGGLFIIDASPAAMAVSVISAHAMIMGGALTLAAYLPAFYAFALPTVLPMVVALAVQGGTTNQVLALQSAIFLALIMHVAKRFNTSLRSVWQLTFEKELLLQELTKANDHQKALANTDGLTGIANRRRFDAVLEEELSRAARNCAPLSLVMLDVDHFKSYNDNYGHVAGDECLQRIAQLLAQQFTRHADLVARYGGEEFAVILPHTDEAGAVQQAQAIRQQMAQLRLPHAYSGTAAHVTVSLGVVTLYASEMYAAHQLIAMADECLYQAKGQGRNRVVSTVYRSAPEHAVALAA